MAALVAGAVGLWPSPALAHSPIDGFDGFYLGLLHPLTSAGQVLALIAVGLVVGTADKAAFARAWLLFAVLAFAGVLFGQLLGVTGGEEGALLGVALLTALMVAATPHATHRRATWMLMAAGASSGLLLGLASTPDEGPLVPTLITVAGSLVGVNLAFLYLAGATGWIHDRYPYPWARIGLRVVASWVAAIAMLMLALAFASVWQA